MDELEQAWPDADRRDDALERLLARVRVQPVELAPHDRLVLAALSHGLTEAEAGEVLGISRHTVHDRAGRARRQLCAKTTVQAVATALRLGLID